MTVSEKEDEKKDDLSWFKDIFPDAKAEFPQKLDLQEEKTYLITFQESKPRVVPDKFGKTGVIEVEYNGESRSLFLGHTYLAQRIYALQKKHGSIQGVKIALTRLKMTKEYIEYEVTEVS